MTQSTKEVGKTGLYLTDIDFDNASSGIFKLSVNVLFKLLLDFL